MTDEPLYGSADPDIGTATARGDEIGDRRGSPLRPVPRHQERSVPSTVQPMIITADPERLLSYYAAVAGAVVTDRTPPEGPIFYLGLRIGDSDLGLVADTAVDGAPAGRVILSIEVPDVDARLVDVRRLGGTVTAGPNDMPWGQRVAHTTDPDGNVVNLTTTDRLRSAVSSR